MWLFWAVFLKYNSHTRKLCHDQYTIQWLLINLQSWETITTIQFKNVSITPKDSSYPFTIAPCSHSQLQATDNLLSVFHIPWNSWNLMTMWSFVFDFFDFSITFLRFTHTVVCISTLFLLPMYSIVWLYHVSCIHSILRHLEFSFLGYYEQCCHEHWWDSLCVDVVLFLLSIFPGVALLGYVVNLCLTF